MRYLQVSKFSFILNRIFGVERSELLTNENTYDRFLRATLIESLLSLVFLIVSLVFMLSILDFIESQNKLIYDFKDDATFNYIFNLADRSRSEFDSKCLFSHSKFGSVLTLQEFYMQAVSNANKENSSNYLILYRDELSKNDSKIRFEDLIETINKNNKTKKIIIKIFHLSLNSNFTSRLEFSHQFGPNRNVFTSVSLMTLKTPNKFDLVSFSLLGCFSLYFLIEEIAKIAAYKLDYFRLVLNLIDLIILILLMTLIGIQFKLINSFELLFKDRTIQMIANKLISVLDLQTNQFNLAIVVVCLAWIKQTKYLNFTVGITQMNATLSVAFADLCSYLLAFLMIFSCFAVLLNRLFGSISKDLNSFFSSQFTLLKFLLGVVDFKTLFEYNSKTSRLIFFSYFLLVFIIFLNIFLAIINSSYSYVLKTYEPKSELDYYEFFKKRFISIRSYRFKNKSKITIMEVKDRRDELEKLPPHISLIYSNEIREPIYASKFRNYLMKNIKNIEETDVDVVFRMNNIREIGKQTFSSALEQIYGDLNDELDNESLETMIMPEQCRDIINKLKLAKRRISFFEKSQSLRKKSFFKPVFYQNNNETEADVTPSCNDSLFSSINSKTSLSVSRKSSRDKNEGVQPKYSEQNVNHEISFKEFDNQHTELVTWKEFMMLRKNLKHLKNETYIISNNFLNEIK